MQLGAVCDIVGQSVARPVLIVAASGPPSMSPGLSPVASPCRLATSPSPVFLERCVAPAAAATALPSGVVHDAVGVICDQHRCNDDRAGLISPLMHPSGLIDSGFLSGGPSRNRG